MTRLRIPFALLLLFVFSLAPHAQRADEPANAARTYQYLIYFMGSKIGWVKSTVQEVELDGRKVRHEHEVAFVQIKRSLDNQVFETNSTVDYWYELDGRLIRKTDKTRQGGQETTLEAVYASDHVQITEVINDGNPVQTKLEFGDKKVQGDYRAWKLVQAGEHKKGDRLKFWSVEEDEHTLLEQSWTYSGRVKRKLSDKTTVEGTEIRIVKGGRANFMIMGDDDMPLYFEDSGGFSIERVSKIPQPFRADPIVLRNVMNANVAIAEFKQLAQMDIHFKYEHDDSEDIELLAESNAYHDVLKYEQGYAIRMKAQKLGKDFKAPKYPLENVPDSVAKYLEATAMCDSNDEVLSAEAAKLVKGKTDAVEAARAIMRFTDRRLDDASGDTGSASARQAYDEKAGDCTEHAALFVALARSAGLPARNIGGFVYISSPDGSIAMFGYHAWAEVWLGEWVPVDPTVGELGTSARYVFYQVDEPGESTGRSRLTRSLRQDIKPVIDRYELEDGTTWKRKGAREFDWK